MRYFTKHILPMVLIISMLLSLGACGGSEGGKGSSTGPSSSLASSVSESSEDAAPSSSEIEDESGDTEAQQTGSGPASLADAEARLLSYIAKDGATYFACAVQLVPGHRYSSGHLEFKDGEKHGGELLYGHKKDWVIYLLDFDKRLEGEVPLSDIQLVVTDRTDDTERAFDSWGDPVPPDEFEQFMVFPAGEHYASFDDGSIMKWSNVDYVDLSIHITFFDADGGDKITVDDLSEEMFDLYASDGTPLDEFLGVPVEFTPKKDMYGLLFRARYGYDGNNTGNLAKDELAAAIEGAQPYYVYHGPDGNDYTVVCDFTE